MATNELVSPAPPEYAGPGAHIDLVPLWRFTLNKHDALLVLKALGGRLLPEEDSAAEDLCNRLTVQRAQCVSEMQRHTERAAKHAQEGK